MKYLAKNGEILRLIIHFTLALVGLLIMSYIINSVGYDNLSQIFKKTRVLNIFLGILIFFTAMNVRALKWKILFKAANYEISNIFLHYFMIASLSIFMPLKSGDFVLPFLKKRNTKKGISIIMLDKLLEMGVLLLFASLSFIYFLLFFDLPSYLQNLFFIGVAIILSVIIAFVSLVLLNKHSLFLFNKNFKGVFISKIIIKFTELLSEFTYTLKIVKKKLIKSIALTGLAWMLEFLTLYFIFISINSADLIHIYASNIVATIVAIASLIPSGMGSGDLTFIFLSKLNGHSLLEASSAIILFRIVIISMLLFLGSFSFFLLRFFKLNSKSKQ